MERRRCRRSSSRRGSRRSRSRSSSEHRRHVRHRRSSRTAAWWRTIRRRSRCARCGAERQSSPPWNRLTLPPSLRQARALYPGEPIAALASFGTGAFAPSVASRPGSWAALAQTLVRAATRTEEVHQLLSDLLPRTATAYFRFNPAVPAFPLNETAPSRLRELQAIGRAAVRSEDGARALERLAGLLTPQAGASARAGGSAEAGGQPWAMWAWPAAALARLRALVGGGEAAPRSRL